MVVINPETPEQRESRWLKFAKGHGHPIPPGAKQDEIWAIRAFWLRSRESQCDSLANLRREMNELQERLEQTERAADRAAFMVSECSKELVEQLQGDMEDAPDAPSPDSPDFHDEEGNS
jgi:hypothetical protein